MTLRFLTAGESHGPALTVILEGLPAGLPITEDLINRELERRQMGFGAGGRMKIEHDRAQLLSGVMDGLTTGAPVALLIENSDHSRWKGKAVNAFTTPRPGHADLTGAVKYGFDDLRPALERASARETAARVAMGALCKALLAEFDIQVGGYVRAIAEFTANLENIPLEKRAALAETNDVRCPDETAAEAMRLRIRQVMDDRDTLGGIVEVAAFGLPVGLGSYAQWDKRLDGLLAAAMLSIPAIKGVEIGSAFENSTLPGTQVHDAILLKDGEIVRKSNHAGGVEGGISNGQPLLLRLAMKPIATTLSPQRTVDLATGQETDTVYERSDFCPVPRAVPVAEAMLAFVLADALLEKLGGDSISELKPRFMHLRKANLKDLPMTGGQIIFWPDQELS
ncbi:MAG: chorismate synthase [Anaerolineaceae bacterium]